MKQKLSLYGDTGVSPMRAPHGRNARVTIKIKQKLMTMLLAVAGVMVFPASLFAQDPEDKIYDARLEGYGTNVTLESSSTALMWLLLFVLAAMCVGVMFKNAKRTHLD